MPIQGPKIPFEMFLARFRDFKASKWPRIVGRIGLAIFDENFDNGGFTDKIFIRWKPRKGDAENRGRRLGDGGKQGGRALLIQTGRLRRSLRTGSISSQAVQFRAGNQDVDYAQMHNEGGRVSETVQVRAHSRRLFMEDEVSGPSARKAKYVQVQTSTSQVRAHTRKLNITMPRRRFMGSSAKLTDRLERRLFLEINRLWDAS